jgi:hypothetical protein
MAAEPTQFEDLRNVYLWKGKAEVRLGYELTTQLIDNTLSVMDQVIQLAPIRSEGAAMGVGYNEGNRELHLNLMSIAGAAPSHQASGDPNGELFVLSSAATFAPPIVHMVDTYNRMFIAHDEPLIAARAATKVWSTETSPSVSDLEADLDDDGTPAPVKFRGVTRWLSYLVGWGYGHETDQNRPEIVRVSLAGDPDLFDPRHYFRAGQRAEPVITCRQAGSSGPGSVLLVFKETETYEIFGYSPETFGIRPADQNYGCVGSRLAVTVGDTVFFWSNQGPRMNRGGESADLALPLDIGGPDPATLVAECAPEEAFAVYNTHDRTVMFVWGRRAYILSTRFPDQLRWSYYEFGETAQPYCGAEFYSTLASGGGGSAPTCWPIIQDGSTVLNDNSIELTWYNSGGPTPPCTPNGNEQVEVYLRDATGGGSWSKYTEVPIDLTGGSPNYQQTLEITGLLALNRYDVSLRYRGGGQYTTGFTDADPAAWNDPSCPTCPDDPPAYRSGLLTTATAPEIVTRSGDNCGLWERISATEEQLTIDIDVLVGYAHLSIEVYRARYLAWDTAVQNLNGMGGGDAATHVLVEAELLLTTLAPGVTEFTDDTVVGEQLHDYRLRYKNAEGTPDYSGYGTIQSCFAGPDGPYAGSLLVVCGGGGSVNCYWVNGSTPTEARTCPPTPPNAHQTEVWGRNVTLAELWTLKTTAAAYGISAPISFSGVTPGDTLRASVRHRTNCFGVYDYSRWFLPGFDQCTAL